MHSAPSNGKRWCQAFLDLSVGKHQVNIRSRCENGSQFFCGEQSATITIVVPAKSAPVVPDNSKKTATSVVQAPASMPTAASSLGVTTATPFAVPNVFGLPFQSTFLQPVPDSLADHSDSNALLPAKSVFASATATVPAPFSSAPSLLPSAAASSWSSFGGAQTSGLWSDHSSLKPYQSNVSWTGPIDDKADAIPPDDATAKANLPSFFAADSVVDFCLEDDDDIADTLGSSIFGFDEELSGTNNDSWPSQPAAAASSSSFAASSASSWGTTNAPASQPKPAPVAVSASATVPPPTQGASPLSPTSPTKTQQQGAAASTLPVQALLALACDATTWSPSDFNDGVRYIFQRLNGVEAATCAMSLRFTFTPHSLMLHSLHVCTGMNS